VPSSILDDLLRRRLVVLSGKGGVGKSLVAAALATAARDRGQKALLVEVGAPLEAARYLGAPPVGSRVTEIAPGLHAVNLDPQGVMDEYVQRTVKVDLLSRRILESPIYRRFFAAAPGLKELMVLGKVMVLEEERAGGFSRRPRFDVVILDAPATGHGLQFLRVPVAASRAVPVGPVGSNARRILAMLRDPLRTALVIVAVPEEMAVVEAAELHRAASREVGLEAAAFVLNACHERRFTSAQEAEVLRLSTEGAVGTLAPGVRLEEGILAARRQVRRRKLTEFYASKVRKSLDLPLLQLPFLYREEIGPAEVALLADRLDGAPA
jgi:anion-transporting  ArsA/GET3 family ATPase